mmetsp:Transcript_65690/g.182845  ORF Transcript_65690/g.182845 Transcript_65690/m.182845 type:complete len:264 (+) Transcript_65690:649-1440(+)
MLRAACQQVVEDNLVWLQTKPQHRVEELKCHLQSIGVAIGLEEDREGDEIGWDVLVLRHTPENAHRVVHFTLARETLDHGRVQHGVHTAALLLHAVEDGHCPVDLAVIDASIKEDAVRHLRRRQAPLAHQVVDFEAFGHFPTFGVALHQRVVRDDVGNAPDAIHLLEELPGLIDSVHGNAGRQRRVVDDVVHWHGVPTHLLEQLHHHLPIGLYRTATDHVRIVLLAGHVEGLEFFEEYGASVIGLRLCGAEEQATPNGSIWRT